MFDPVLGENARVGRFVADHIPGCERGFDNFTAIGFGKPLVAGIVYHNWNPEAGVIELSAAATRHDWLSRRNLGLIFGYPFDQLGCQMCVARISEHNARTRRIWRALGAVEHVIPRLRGRDEAEVLSTLTKEAWDGFWRKTNGKKLSPESA